MKTFVYALVAALLLAGQLFAPVSAAAADSTAAQSTCGDTYTVVRGDYLSKIARNCNVPLQTIINLNPQITNINRIYPGQVIRLTSDGTIPVTGGTYVVQRGDYLSLIARRFGTTVAELLRLNPEITNPSRIYPGQVIRLPAGATGTSVTLSSTAPKPGATVTVTVRGFPANANIDYRTGKQGQAYVNVVDGKTNASGQHSATITIPSTAVKGEKWVVRVLTTDLTTVVEVTSPVMTIQ
jgi:LysM repeat protein